MAIITEVLDHVLVVTMNRPEKMNALDVADNDSLAAAWTWFEADSDLRVAVLTGAGSRAFSAGADLKTLIPAFRERLLRDDHDAQWNFGGGLARGLTLTKPLVAAINGHALAGGLEMALACDIRLCSPNATFSLAEARWAIIPGAGGTQRLPLAIPLTHAMEMLLTGDPIDAELACRIGLVSRVVPQDSLLENAMSLARKIASRGPLAVAAIKSLVQMSISHSAGDGARREHELFVDVMKSEDAKEGSAAFAESRSPIYVGR